MPARVALARAARWFVDHGFVKGPHRSERIRRSGRLERERRVVAATPSRPQGPVAAHAVRAVPDPTDDGSRPSTCSALARAAGQRGVRAARALREPADAARAAHDRFRRRLRARRGRVPLRPRRPPLPRLPRRLRRLRARPLPSRDRAGAARRRWTARAAEPRADGVRAALGAAGRGARRPHADRRLPVLLHQQRGRVGRDRDRSTCGARPAVSRVLFADHAFHGLTIGALVAERRQGVPRPLRRAVPRLHLRALRRPRRLAARVAEGRRRRVRRRTDPGQGCVRRARRLPARRRPSCVTRRVRCSPSTRCRPASAARERSSRSSSGASSPTS